MWKVLSKQEKGDLLGQKVTNENFHWTRKWTQGDQWMTSGWYETEPTSRFEKGKQKWWGWIVGSRRYKRRKEEKKNKHERFTLSHGGRGGGRGSCPRGEELKKASILNYTHHRHKSYSYIIMITVVNVNITGRGRDKQWRGTPWNQVPDKIGSV